ncbi:MAG TPA: hypothetical protein VFG50_11315, partial [Rhodothermales bacterium]|nr:hypothetical protein [Rhodothermales bacterium]
MDSMHWIYQDLHLGVVRMNGAVRGTDVVAELHGLYSDSAWQRGFDTLWDARSIDMLDFSLLDLSAFREQSASMMEAQGSGRIAIAVHREVVFDI